MTPVLQMDIDIPGYDTTSAPAVEFIDDSLEDIDVSSTEGIGGYILVFDDSDIPASFWNAVSDYESGRLVDLDTALNESPPTE